MTDDRMKDTAYVATIDTPAARLLEIIINTANNEAGRTLQMIENIIILFARKMGDNLRHDIWLNDLKEAIDFNKTEEAAALILLARENMMANRAMERLEQTGKDTKPC